MVGSFLIEEGTILYCRFCFYYVFVAVILISWTCVIFWVAKLGVFDRGQSKFDRLYSCRCSASLLDVLSCLSETWAQYIRKFSLWIICASEQLSLGFLIICRWRVHHCHCWERPIVGFVVWFQLFFHRRR